MLFRSGEARVFGANMASQRHQVLHRMNFESPYVDVPMRLTVRQNLEIYGRLYGVRDLKACVAATAEELRLSEFLDRPYGKLSAGQKTRVSLAKALLNEPELLLLDEPFAALDAASREELLRDFQRIVKETKITTVFITHDGEEAFALADKVVVLKNGLPLQFGRYDEVFFRPNSAASAEICGIANRLAGTIEAHDGEFDVARVDQLRLRTTVKFPAGAKVILCIRPENVLLSRDPCPARNFNQLAGKIISILPGIAHYRITLDCGAIGLVALVERRSFLESGHRENDMVTAVFSPSSVHVVEEDATVTGDPA